MCAEDFGPLRTIRNHEENGIAMKTHFFLMSMMVVLGATVWTTSDAANTSEYLHFTRHRDSQGNLLMAPTQPRSMTSVMKKTMMPSQLKTFERRSTDWGMSAQDVKANEPVQPSWELQAPILAEYEQRVAYRTQIEGIDAALTYTFYEGHLGQAKYVFESQHDDAVDSVQDFYIVKKWISRSYGPPTFVQKIWLDVLYQYDQSLWGQAVLRGHLVMAAEWKQSGTDIVLVLDGGDDEIGLVADFSSPTFVRPVSFDVGSVEGNAEEVMEEKTVQEVLSAESMENVNREDHPAQETLIEQTGIAGHSSDAEMASNASNELDEIEAMLNEEFPELEPLEPASIEPSIEGNGQELPHDPQASMPLEELAPDAVDHQALSLEPTYGEGLLEEHPIELSLDEFEFNHDPQVSMPLEELTRVEGITEEHSMMPVIKEEGHELNLDPQVLMGMDDMAQYKMDTLVQEPVQVEKAMVNPTIEPGNYSQTSEHFISNVSENVAGGVEEMTSEHATHDDSVDDHFIVDHVNESVIEPEAELEGLHL